MDYIIYRCGSCVVGVIDHDWITIRLRWRRQIQKEPAIGAVVALCWFGVAFHLGGNYARAWAFCQPQTVDRVH